jgi:hypothetical protein
MFSMYLPNETNVMSMVDVSKKTWVVVWVGRELGEEHGQDRVGEGGGGAEDNEDVHGRPSRA